MSISFDLKYSQFVAIDIQITVHSPKGLHILTRLMVDGVEDRKFRSIVGNTAYVGISLNKKIWLNKGKHNVKVEYRESASYLLSSPAASDWNVAYFAVEYL